MNAAAFQLEEQLGFDWASDTRGEGPFIPVIAGREIACVQLPTTLPTLDELLGRNGLTEDNVHDAVLRLTAYPSPGRVFTLHAEMEGLRLLPVLTRLLEGWRAQGYDSYSLGQMCGNLNIAALPRCEVVSGTRPGRTGRLALQGPPH